MHCPACGSPMETKTCDETLTYAGKSVTLHDMKGDFCVECGEGVWDETSYCRYEEEQDRMLNSLGEELRSIRKKLKMTQTQLAECLGIGKVAFSRYERGVSRPSPPLVMLVRLMGRHPELLREITCSHK